MRASTRWYAIHSMLSRNGCGSPRQEKSRSADAVPNGCAWGTHRAERQPGIGESPTVCAQDATPLGVLPIMRRRMTAYGVQPVLTVTHQFDNFYLYGAVEPTTGESFFLAQDAQPWASVTSSTIPVAVPGFLHRSLRLCHARSLRPWRPTPGGASGPPRGCYKTPRRSPDGVYRRASR